MSHMTWKDAYSTGVARIDDDHKRIVKMINETYAACLASGKDRCPCSILDDMRDYATTHFQLEERFMSDHAYPDVDEHVAEHRYFLAKVEEMEQAAGNGKGPDIKGLYRFLSIWLISHIMNCDKKLGTFLVETGADDI